MQQSQPMQHSVTSPAATAETWRLQIQYNAEWQEYRIAVYVNGKYCEGPTYYADSKADAYGTLAYMMDETERNGHIAQANLDAKPVYRQW